MVSDTYKNLLLDIGSVDLFYSTAEINTGVSSRTVKSILDSSAWHDYERGSISQDQCYDAVTEQFGLDLATLSETVSQLRSAFRPSQELIAAVKGLKTNYPQLRVHAFSKISAADFASIEPMVKKCAIFDSIITSSSLGCRKPDLDAYQKALDAIGGSARSTIFVDDRSENAVAAHSLGIQTIVFDDGGAVVRRLHNLLGDSVARGMEFLRQGAQRLFSESDRGTPIRDNFTQLLILHCTGYESLVRLENEGSTWQFFIGERSFTDDNLPKDTDTTALAISTLGASDEEKQAVLDAILDNLTADQLPLVYFDKSRPRFCPAVSANVLRLFYLNGRGHQLRATLEYLCRILKTRAFEVGTRYYCQADWILYYLADLCQSCESSDLDELRGLVAAQLERRTGSDRDALAAALRVVASHSLGLENPRDLETLRDAQQLDGGWELSWMFQYGNVDVKIGSRGVTTAFAVKALRTACEIAKQRDDQRLITSR